MLARHRRPIAALSAAVCVGATVLTLRPLPPPTVSVAVAARDLPGGHRLGPADVVMHRWPTDARPDGALTHVDDAVGRPLAAPLRRGEPVTDVRLVGTGLVDSLPTGLVGVPVRIADADAAGLVTAGDHVDVLAATASDLASATPGSARVVARDVTVLARPGDPDSGGLLGGGDLSSAGQSGALIVLATSTVTATDLAAAAATGALSLVLRGR